MSFAPNPENLQQVVQLVEYMTNAQNTQMLNTAREKFEHFNNTSSEFSNYLAHIFASPEYHMPLRNFAGLSLKNKLTKSQYISPQMHGNTQSISVHSFTEHQMAHIKSCLVKTLSDPNDKLRTTSANIIVSIVRKYTLKFWPELMDGLISLLQYSDDAKAGAFKCLLMLCEDLTEEFEHDETDPLAKLVPVLIQFFEHPDVKWKIESIKVYEALLQTFPSAALQNMDNFLNGLTKLVSVQDTTIQRYICSCFVIMLERPRYLNPVWKNVVEFMLMSTANENDEQLAQEACKFWMTISEAQALKPLLQELKPYLPRLVPILLKGTIFSEFERRMKEEDSMAPAKDSEINPAIQIETKVHTIGTDGEDDESFDEDEAQEYLDDIWNLRKYSAQSLDNMSQFFGAEILPHLLPHVENYMKEGNPWYVRESGVLALGAVEKGCGKYLEQYLPQLIPYLMSIAAKEMALLRSIACWTISRFSDWISAQNEEVFQSILKLFLECMLDTNKKVQEAAASALCSLQESAQLRLVPYLPQIADTVAQCFTMYKHKNLLILYDAVGTLAEAVRDNMAVPEIVNKLVTPMLHQWHQMQDNDRKMHPLMAAITILSCSVKKIMKPYAEVIVARCIRIVHSSYTSIQEDKANLTEGKRFVVTALDCLSGIIEALGEDASYLLSNEGFFKMLHICLTDPKGDVKQVSFGVIGDMAKEHIQALKVGLPKFMPILADNLTKVPPHVATNAAWALGEIAVFIKGDFAQYLDLTLQELIKLLENRKGSANLLENASVAIGRIGWVCPQQISPHLESFCKNWCLALCRVEHPVEKDQAFRGLCELIRHNNQAAINFFPYICDAIASFANPQDDLKFQMQAILVAVKNAAGTNWEAFYSQLNPKLRTFLSQNYGL